MASYGSTETPAPANKQPLLEKYSSGKVLRSTPPADAAASSAASAAGDEEVKDQSAENERKAAEQREAAKKKADAAAASSAAPLATSGVGNFGILVIVTQLIVFICYGGSHGPTLSSCPPVPPFCVTVTTANAALDTTAAPPPNILSQRDYKHTAILANTSCRSRPRPRPHPSPHDHACQPSRASRRSSSTTSPRSSTLPSFTTTLSVSI